VQFQVHQTDIVERVGSVGIGRTAVGDAELGQQCFQRAGVISRVDVNLGNQVECLHHSILVVEILKDQAGFQQIIKRKLIVGVGVQHSQVQCCQCCSCTVRLTGKFPGGCQFMRLAGKFGCSLGIRCTHQFRQAVHQVNLLMGIDCICQVGFQVANCFVHG